MTTFYRIKLYSPKYQRLLTINLSRKPSRDDVIQLLMKNTGMDNSMEKVDLSPIVQAIREAAVFPVMDEDTRSTASVIWRNQDGEKIQLGYLSIERNEITE